MDMGGVLPAKRDDCTVVRNTARVGSMDLLQRFHRLCGCGRPVGGRISCSPQHHPLARRSMKGLLQTVEGLPNDTVLFASARGPVTAGRIRATATGLASRPA